MANSAFTGVGTNLSNKADIASPTFTGTPAAPTAAADTNTTQLATTAFVLAQAASQAELESASSTTKFVTAGRAQYHPSSAKCWIKCNAAGATQASYNINSITDTGTGIVTITIETDFSSVGWACVVGGQGSGTTVTLAKAVSVSSQAAGSVVLSAYDFSATPVLEDPSNYFFAGFGDQ